MRGQAYPERLMSFFSDPVIIRRAVVADAPRIAVVHVSSRRWAYRGIVSDAYLDAMSVSERETMHRERLNAEGAWRTWLAESDGVVLGFVSTCPSRDADATPLAAEVARIYVAPEAAGLGVGGTLLAHAVADLLSRGYTCATLWVLRENQRARRFYERHGWAWDCATTNWDMGGDRFEVFRYRRSL
jgi:ribosomal protein S18 acetylase RimI-like enzyme